MANGFTPTHERILAVLSDGLPHTKEELHACLDDELATDKAVQNHIVNMRKILRMMGQDIVCRVIGWKQFRYQHVRLLGNPYKG